MAKAIKAFSLDLETVELIENYTYEGTTSRSRLVNNAIKWYISGDYDELVRSHKSLMEKFREVCIDRERLQDQLGIDRSPKSWWRRLLGL